MGTVTLNPVAIADAATYTVKVADNGATHYLPDLTADITISLPTAAPGLYYKFVYGGVGVEAQDWAIDTGSTTNYYLGGVTHVDDAPAANAIASDGNSNRIVNVLTPEVSTWVEVHCDGTNWYVNGWIASANAPTFADS